MQCRLTSSSKRKLLSLSAICNVVLVTLPQDLNKFKKLMPMLMSKTVTLPKTSLRLDLNICRMQLCNNLRLDTTQIVQDSTHSSSS